MSSSSFDEIKSFSNDSIPTPTHLKIQINAYDNYLIDFPGDKYDKVPIIRIYGRTNTNNNILVHVHNVFPYFLIKRVVINKKNIEDDCKNLHQKLEDLLWDFYSSKKSKKNNKQNSLDESDDEIDEELNVSDNDLDASQIDESLLKKKKKKNNHNHNKNNKIAKKTLKSKLDRSKTFKYIAKVEAIKGKEFYGYHEDFECFYKISLLKPNSLKRLVDLLYKKENIHIIPNSENGHIKILEAHIPFFLQFCIDFNLYGCSWLDLKKFSYRLPVLNPKSAQIFEDDLFVSLINENNFSHNNLERMGNCLLEIDINPNDILNSDALLDPINDDDPKDAISSTNAVWDALNKIRNSVGLETYKSSQSQNQFISRNSFHHEKHELIEKTYNALIEKEKIKLKENKVTKKQHLSIEIERLPTLLESNLKKTTTTTNNNNNDNRTKFNSKCNNISPRKLTTNFTINKRQKLQEQQNKNIPNLTQRQVSITEKIMIENEKKNFKITFNNIEESLEDLGFKKNEYFTPFFQDFEEFKKFKTGKHLNSKSHLIKCMDPNSKLRIHFKNKTVINKTLNYSKPGILEFIRKPPTYNDIIEESINSKDNNNKNNNTNTFSNLYGSFFQSQTQNIIPKTWKHKHKLMQNKISMHSSNDDNISLHSPISNMFMELITSTQLTGRIPDPEIDEILFITWSLEAGNIGALQHNKGMFVKMSENSNEYNLFLNQLSKKIAKNFEVVFYDNEKELISKFSEFVSILDPDILSGFEVHNESWGFLLNRGDFFNIDLASILSRVNNQQINKMGDFWGYTHTSSILITGRHILNLWRALKNETKLESFTLENFAYHLLHKRIPKFSNDFLFKNWKQKNYKALINYIIIKIEVCVEMIDSLSFIQKTAEQARITGVDFYSVIYRGSQFKVESLLARICRRENYVMFSPSQKMVRTQKPMECIALIMEPDSQMYTDPLVVLDFQSLYPSIMIAFNLCYSTVIGDTNLLQKENNNNNVMLGADKNYQLKTGLLHDIGLENITLTTNGALFVKKSQRKSILAKMLTNLLETRVMIKNTMSDLKKKISQMSDNNKFDTLLRDLEGMQMALKFVLAVTYGYTAASHNGRMPLQELADSVVEMGRTVLTQSIHFINNSTKWGAKVVYTDTDSLFVLFPGKTRQEAFKYGREMAKLITENNPAPIKLQFEKLYHPCILVTKKRYVGNMYETESVSKPSLQAKGLEIIRRDGTPLLQKLMETSINLLFDSCNITIVQNFITREFEKLYKGKYLIQDLCFSRKVKLGHYKRDNSLPPAAYLAKEIMDNNSRAEAQYKQTVRYVVVRKEDKKALLREKAMTPVDFMRDKKKYHLQLDMEYYIIKHLIPPLNRIYNLIGIDCEPWFYDVKNKYTNDYDISFQNRKSNSNYIPKVSIKYCENCHEIRILPTMKLCFKCLKKYDVFLKNERNNLKEIMKKEVLNNVCKNCIGYDNRDLVGNCVSQDCPVFYQREDN